LHRGAASPASPAFREKIHPSPKHSLSLSLAIGRDVFPNKFPQTRVSSARNSRVLFAFLIKIYARAISNQDKVRRWRLLAEQGSRSASSARKFVARATSRDIFRPPCAARRAFNDIIKHVGSSRWPAQKQGKTIEAAVAHCSRFRRCERADSIADAKRCRWTLQFYSATFLNDTVT